MGKWGNGEKELGVDRESRENKFWLIMLDLGISNSMVIKDNLIERK